MLREKGSTFSEFIGENDNFSENDEYFSLVSENLLQKVVIIFYLRKCEKFKENLQANTDCFLPTEYGEKSDQKMLVASTMRKFWVIFIKFMDQLRWHQK